MKDNSTKEESLVQTALSPIKALLPSLIPIAIIYAPGHALISSFFAFAAGVVIVDNQNFFKPKDKQKEKSQNFFKKIGNSLYTNLPALIPLIFMGQTSLSFTLIAAPAVVASYGSCKALTYLVNNSFTNIKNQSNKDQATNKIQPGITKDINEEISLKNIAQIQEVGAIKEQLKANFLNKDNSNKELNKNSKDPKDLLKKY